MKAEELSPISPQDWTYERAAHLLERAGFGGTPEEIEALAAMTPEAAVASLVDYESADNSHLAPFEHSGLWDPTLKNFPVSRPAATELAERTGESMGVRVKPGGDRPVQPVANRFFYWLRATLLETRRVAAWWANRMVVSNRPLEEKMALFWHGHFANGEDKIRDYRKMLVQLELFHKHATGSFRDLLVAIAQDPAMLIFLDAGQNVKGAPNENFGREVMELFTMGVGNYTEDDIREASRAFTGWGNDDLAFTIDPSKHDDGAKTFLGRTGNFNGVDILNIILEQPVTARYVASKIYRFFVRENVSPEMAEALGDLFRDGNYELKPFLRTVFLSQDFYSDPSVGTHIKSPVELVVSTYRKLGLRELPGIPDLYSVSRGLGQVLLNPPTVAGWAQGRAWITPGLLLERGNFAREVLFPNIIDFVDPNYDPGDEIKRVNRNILAGRDITSATLDDDTPENGAMGEQPVNYSNVIASAEKFNTRYASLVGWQEAVRRLIPMKRAAAQFSLTDAVVNSGAKTTTDVVDAFTRRFLRVPIAPHAREALVSFLESQLGTSDVAEATTYMETPLRVLAHLILSSPQYQLA